MKKKLIELASKARIEAYAPYSHFLVGAAVKTREGHIYTGCNVENASFGATICAERVALCKAISEGEKEFLEMAIVVDSAIPCAPCGICRQFIAEFAPDLKIYSATLSGQTETYQLSNILPAQFSGRFLIK